MTLSSYGALEIVCVSLLLLLLLFKNVKSRAVAEKPRDATVNFDLYGVCRQAVVFL